MKMAIVGATHGNELTGVEVCKILEDRSYKHQFKTFIGNPKALEERTRYVDSDLNRSYSDAFETVGYEKERSAQMRQEIEGQYDFLMDIHSTTSNMGLTLILTQIDEVSLKAACYVKKHFPDLKLILSVRAGDDCPYTPSLTPSGFTIEVGPIANNIVKANLVFDVLKMCELVLEYDFEESFDYSTIEVFETYKIQHFPEDGQWFIHPEVDYNDFTEINKGMPLFINAMKEVINHQEETTVYPLFINEAAYQEHRIAMELATKTTLDKILKN